MLLHFWEKLSRCPANGSKPSYPKRCATPPTIIESNLVPRVNETIQIPWPRFRALPNHRIRLLHLRGLLLVGCVPPAYVRQELCQAALLRVNTGILDEPIEHKRLRSIALPDYTQWQSRTWSR